MNDFTKKKDGLILIPHYREAKNMAKDVHRALLSVIVQAGGKTEKQADELMKNLSSAGRYLQDVWA
jgi:sulfite reductase alpha subunit-like flavoprotein